MLVDGSTRTETGASAGAGAAAALARGLGALGLIGIVVCAFLVSAGAASGPSRYVPARSGGWPSWLAGPLRGLGIGLSSGGFQTLVLIMCASYLLVLLVARRLPLAALAGAIVLADVIVALGPPLISQDVFGYLAFARLGVLHGLDPYTHIAAEAPTDAVFHFIGWPFQNSPYGPLFTLLSYALVPLGPAGALWAFKAIAVLASLGAVALTARAASRLGQSPNWAAAFVGLNPVLVLLAVALVGLLGFGVHTLGFVGAVGEQQQLVASHSIPAETARLVGLSGTPSWWRHAFLGGFLVVLAFALWRTARGADWRVAAGWSTLALLVSTAWLLPWYAIWALPLAAVSGDRRLRAATLLLCAYAVLIHLPLADAVLSPPVAHLSGRVHVPVPHFGHRLELAGFQVLHHVKVDLRW